MYEEIDHCFNARKHENEVQEVKYNLYFLLNPRKVNQNCGVQNFHLQKLEQTLWSTFSFKRKLVTLCYYHDLGQNFQQFNIYIEIKSL